MKHRDQSHQPKSKHTGLDNRFFLGLNTRYRQYAKFSEIGSSTNVSIWSLFFSVCYFQSLDRLWKYEPKLADHNQSETVRNDLSGNTFTDRHGYTWRKIDDINSYVPFNSVSDPIEISDPTNFPPFSDLTVEEISELYRPILEYNKKVYALTEKDADKVAQKMYKAYHDNAFPSSGAGEASGSQQTSTSTQGVVIKTDNRANVTNPSAYPNGQIANAGGHHGCTAFKLLNHHTAVTAAHCMYEPQEGWHEPKDWHWEGKTTKHLNPSCYSRIIPWAYAFQLDTGFNVPFDFGVIRLKSSFNSCNESAYNVGYLGWATMAFDDGNKDEKIIGWPADKQKQFLGERGEAWPGYNLPRRIVSKIDATEGQSGSPILDNVSGVNRRRVVGLYKGNSFIISPSPVVNHGPRFQPGIYNFISIFGGYVPEE